MKNLSRQPAFSLINLALLILGLLHLSRVVAAQKPKHNNNLDCVRTQDFRVANESCTITITYNRGAVVEPWALTSNCLDLTCEIPTPRPTKDTPKKPPVVHHHVTGAPTTPPPTPGPTKATHRPTHHPRHTRPPHPPTPRPTRCMPASGVALTNLAEASTTTQYSVGLGSIRFYDGATAVFCVALVLNNDFALAPASCFFGTDGSAPSIDLLQTIELSAGFQEFSVTARNPRYTRGFYPQEFQSDPTSTVCKPNCNFILLAFDQALNPSANLGFQPSAPIAQLLDYAHVKPDGRRQLMLRGG